MKMNPELRHPRPIYLCDPGVRRRPCISDPEAQGDRKVGQDGQESDPAWGGRIHDSRSPRQYAGGEENDDDPKENHKRIAIATNNAVPRAIPAAYHLTFPVWVMLKALFANLPNRARPL